MESEKDAGREGTICHFLVQALEAVASPQSPTTVQGVSFVGAALPFILGTMKRVQNRHSIPTLPS